MPFVESGGIRFHYALSGSRGPLVVFQHGLGGEISQPQGILGSSALMRTFSFDCRGHGLTEPLGRPEHLRFSAFADDLRAVLDALGFDNVIVGGISMGAGVALSFVLRNPTRARALIMSRPAWLDQARPPNLEILRRISRWLKDHGLEKTRKLLLADEEFARVQKISRDSAASILRQLERPNLQAAIATLASLPEDTPCPRLEAWHGVSVPTLVLVNSADPLHPIEYGRRLAAGISGSRLREITSKEKDLASHVRETREAIEKFVLKLGAC